jgi:hypothetical protein
MELGKSLGPLEPFKTKLNFITGLFNKPATGVGIHPGQTGNILSGVPLQKGAVLRGGISMDQVLANRLGQDTLQPSMVLGCEQPNTGYHETNFSMAYSSHISWSSPTSPVPMEVYPSLAFDSLFENRGARRTQSILDQVAGRPGPFKARSPPPTAPSWTSTSPACARWRSGCERARPAREQRRSPWSAPATACPRTSASTCA